MPRRVFRAILAPVVLCLAACGGGSPTRPQPVAATPTPTPSPTPVPPPVAREGVNHEVVPAEIEPTAPALRDAVTVRAAGFLLREQRYDGAPIYLWQVEQEYVNELVYPLTFTDGSFRMIRWAGPFTVTLEAGLETNDAVMRKTQEIVAEATRASGLPITIGPNGAVRVVVDGALLNDNLLGQAQRTYQGATIVGGTIKLASIQDLLGTNRADYTNVYLHEMGHILGLGHSPLAREIMTAGGGARTTLGEFQPREAMALHMMYQHRLAGNRPPDKDGALFTQSVARPLVSVIDN